MIGKRNFERRGDYIRIVLKILVSFVHEEGRKKNLQTQELGGI